MFRFTVRRLFSNPLDCSRLLALLVARRQTTQLVHVGHHAARCHANPTIQCVHELEALLLIVTFSCPFPYFFQEFTPAMHML